jgi:hypothetical protein
MRFNKNIKMALIGLARRSYIVAVLNGMIPNGSTFTDAVNIINAAFDPLAPLKQTVRDGLLPFTGD